MADLDLDELGRAAAVQIVADKWKAWRSRVPWDGATLHDAACTSLLLAADAGLTPDELRELARRIRP